MKVAIISQPYDGILPPNQNSIGLIVYNTAIELARHVSVTLYGKRRESQMVPVDLPFDTSFVSSGADDFLQYLSNHYPRWATRLGIPQWADTFPGYVRSVSRSLDRKDHQVVHVMNYWNWCRRLKGQSKNRRLVLEMQAEWLSQKDEQHVSRELASVDAVVAVSDHIAKLFRASFPAYRGLVATAYNGVNVEDFKPAVHQDTVNNGIQTVLFVGRVSPEKGIHTLLEAFAQIVSTNENARLVIVGPRLTLREDFIVSISADPLVQALKRFYTGTESTEYQKYLDKQVERLKLQDKVRLPGRLPHKELVELYRSASVVVNPSLSESFGISIVEGMACGVPVVGTKVGGMLETIVDGETGLLVDAESPDMLANAVRSLLNDPQLSASMGSKGRARAVNQFSWRARAERLVSVYQTVVNR